MWNSLGYFNAGSRSIHTRSFLVSPPSYYADTKRSNLWVPARRYSFKLIGTFSLWVSFSYTQTHHYLWIPSPKFLRLSCKQPEILHYFAHILLPLEEFLCELPRLSCRHRGHFLWVPTSLAQIHLEFSPLTQTHLTVLTWVFSSVEHTQR